MPGVPDELLAVQVTQRCAIWRAATLCLGVHALEHFGRQVVGVILSNVGHHVVEQLACRRLVHRLSHRDQLGSGAGYGGVDLDIIGSVAGQPVDFVDDHEVNALGFQLAQHLL
ncbi:hypothetical protein [Micromonospora sp. WMMD1082]|uniref:hypothetical protein n=1 Tax=Micromonospora sp. WMMD1082 TaxID=3016104 RepID=UPI00241720A3|nr:hypothetical protein [Micromonospora sp. WMMD1082]MDG4796009.1 hypothetical protein [Micromonospora sp. WMMD1082]